MTMLRSFSHACLGGLVLMGGLACAQAGDPPAAKPASAAPGASSAAASAATRAVADLKPTQGSSVQGRVTFTAEKGAVHVVADLTGLTPGEHGFHIHEKGDCSAPDGTSAGGHFNPGRKPHGAPDAAEHHAGDLGNVTADASGKAHIDAVFPFMTLAGPDTIVGRGLIVHAAPDDMKTQPTGNAGARQACGVIRAE